MADHKILFDTKQGTFAVIEGDPDRNNPVLNFKNLEKVLEELIKTKNIKEDDINGAAIKEAFNTVNPKADYDKKTKEEKSIFEDMLKKFLKHIDKKGNKDNKLSKQDFDNYKKPSGTEIPLATRFENFIKTYKSRGSGLGQTNYEHIKVEDLKRGEVDKFVSLQFKVSDDADLDGDGNKDNDKSFAITENNESSKDDSTLNSSEKGYGETKISGGKKIKYSYATHYTDGTSGASTTAKPTKPGGTKKKPDLGDTDAVKLPDPTKPKIDTQSEKYLKTKKAAIEADKPRMAAEKAVTNFKKNNPKAVNLAKFEETHPGSTADPSKLKDVLRIDTNSEDYSAAKLIDFQNNQIKTSKLKFDNAKYKQLVNSYKEYSEFQKNLEELLDETDRTIAPLENLVKEVNEAKDNHSQRVKGLKDLEELFKNLITTLSKHIAHKDLKDAYLDQINTFRNLHLSTQKLRIKAEDLKKRAEGYINKKGIKVPPENLLHINAGLTEINLEFTTLNLKDKGSGTMENIYNIERVLKNEADRHNSTAREMIYELQEVAEQGFVSIKLSELETKLSEKTKKADNALLAFRKEGGKDLKEIKKENPEDSTVIAIASTAKTKGKQRPIDPDDFVGAKMENGQLLKEITDPADASKKIKLDVGAKYGLDIRAATRKLLAKFPKANPEEFDAEIAKYFLSILQGDTKSKVDAEARMAGVKAKSLDPNFGYKDYPALAIGGNYGLVSKVDDYIFGSINGRDKRKRLLEFYEFFSGNGKAGSLNYDSEIERKRQNVLARNYIGTMGQATLPIMTALTNGAGADEYVKALQDYILSKPVGSLPPSMGVFTMQTGERALDTIQIASPANAGALLGFAESLEEVTDENDLDIPKDLMKLLPIIAPSISSYEVELTVEEKTKPEKAQAKIRLERQAIAYLIDKKFIKKEKVKPEEGESPKEAGSSKSYIYRPNKERITNFITKQIAEIRNKYVSALTKPGAKNEKGYAAIEEQYLKLLELNKTSEPRVFGAVTEHYRPISAEEMSLSIHSFVDNLKKFEAASKAGTLPKNDLETHDAYIAKKRTKAQEKIKSFEKRWSGQVRDIVQTALPRVNRSLKDRIPGYDSLAQRGRSEARFDIINRNPRQTRRNRSNTFSSLEIRFS